MSDILEYVRTWLDHRVWQTRVPGAQVAVARHGELVLSEAYGVDLSGLLPARRPVEVDVETGQMRIDSAARRVRDLTDDHQVYAAYLFLLCTARGAAPGERVRLRSSDVELLVSVLGQEPRTVEQRLVSLMGCTPEEASLLSGVLLTQDGPART